MDLGAELGAVLPELRRHAESRMVDACEIGRGDGTVDPLTGMSGASATVYAGRCEVSTYEPQEQASESAGASVTEQRYRFKVPVGSYRPEVGDVATVTASEHDPHLVGRVFRVVALLHKSHATAYRLGAVEVL